MAVNGSQASNGAINEILSELIDVLQEVKQAQWKIPAADGLHGALDDLRTDLSKWARVLVEEDDALGVSPLSAMASAAGRTPSNFWPGVTSREEVSRALLERLDQLREEIALRLGEEENDRARRTLADMEQDLEGHRKRLGALHP